MSTTYPSEAVSKFNTIEELILRHKRIPEIQFTELMPSSGKLHYQLRLIRACCEANNFTMFARTISFMMPFSSDHLAYLCYICLQYDRLDFVQHLLNLEFPDEDVRVHIFGGSDSSIFVEALDGGKRRVKRIVSISEMHLLLSHGVCLFESGASPPSDLITNHVARSAWKDVESAILSGLASLRMNLPLEMEDLICEFVMAHSGTPTNSGQSQIEKRKRKTILKLEDSKKDDRTSRHAEHLAVICACLDQSQPINHSEYWVNKALNDPEFLSVHVWDATRTRAWFQNAVSQKLWTVAGHLLPRVQTADDSLWTSCVDSHLGRTILHDAVRQRAYSFVEALVKRMDVGTINARDRNGNSPLLEACEMGDARMVDVLVAHGADVDATNNWKTNALIRVCAAPLSVSDDEVMDVCKVLCEFWRMRLGDDEVGQRVEWVSEDVRLPGDKTALSCALHRKRQGTASFLRAQVAR